MEINISGINLNYIVEGKGSPIVVLHGWGANINTVVPIVNVLAENYKVYALDLPGFGQSEEPDEVIGSFGYVEIVKEFMDKMGIEKASFVGHSFGGKLSIIFGVEYPQLVDKLVLIDSAGLIPRRGPKYYSKVYSFKALRWIYKNLFFWIANENRLKKFYEKFGSDDYRDSQGMMRKIFVKVVNENLKPLLKDINSPTLLIWGDKDDATPLYMGKIMENEIKDSGLVVIENGGHYSYLDNYSKFSAVIRSFFKQ